MAQYRSPDIAFIKDGSISVGDAHYPVKNGVAEVPDDVLDHLLTPSSPVVSDTDHVVKDFGKKGKVN